MRLRESYKMVACGEVPLYDNDSAKGSLKNKLYN
jgi:hypothetical protein